MPESPVAWVIGGGSGIGRASAEALAAAGHHVVVSGRRAAERADVVQAVSDAGGSASECAVDVTDDASLAGAAASIAETHGPVRTLVYSAGTNVVQRFWADSESSAIAGVMDVNVQGAVRAVHAVLPGMRESGGGLVVLVSSWAAWRYSPGAGAAYSMSKTALGVLAETLNAEQRHANIRATHLCPGEVATEILDTRPVPPSAEARAAMLRAEDVGEAVAWIAAQPARVCINELILTPTANASYA